MFLNHPPRALLILPSSAPLICQVQAWSLFAAAAGGDYRKGGEEEDGYRRRRRPRRRRQAVLSRVARGLQVITLGVLTCTYTGTREEDEGRCGETPDLTRFKQDPLTTIPPSL